MFSRMYSFARRNRYKLVATSAVVGGVALLGKLAEAKLRALREEETRRLLEATMRGHQGRRILCSQFIYFGYVLYLLDYSGCYSICNSNSHTHGMI